MSVSNKGEKYEDSSKVAIVLGELVSSMESHRNDSKNDSVASCFKLSELVKMYATRLQELGVELLTRVNSTRLKERILSMVPDIVAQGKGREVLLLFEKDVGDAIIKAKANDHDGDAIHLMRAVQTSRREMSENTYQFKGYFEPGCQENSVPQTLLSLVSMILEGPDIQQQTHKDTSRMKVALSLAQLL